MVQPEDRNSNKFYHEGIHWKKGGLVGTGRKEDCWALEHSPPVMNVMTLRVEDSWLSNRYEMQLHFHFIGKLVMLLVVDFLKNFYQISVLKLP